MATLFVMAMPQELKGVCRFIKNVTKHSSSHYSAKTASGKSMVFIATGMGAVQIALSIQDHAKNEDFSAVIMLGVGGGLHIEQNIGELIIAKRIIAYDSFASFEDERILVRPGDYISDSKSGASHDHHFHSDETLVKFCEKCAGIPADVLSGNEMVLSSSRKKEFADEFTTAHLVEMEGVGLALAARRLGIPFVMAKGLADRQTENPASSMVEDFRANFTKAIESSAQVAKLWQQEK